MRIIIYMPDSTLFMGRYSNAIGTLRCPADAIVLVEATSQEQVSGSQAKHYTDVALWHL
jgi:hypothetical protein